MSSSVVASSIAVGSSGKVILPTVPAILCRANGCSKVVRCFFDPGSQTSFVRQSVVDDLGLDGKSIRIAVSGFGGEPTKNTLRKRIAFTVAPVNKPGELNVSKHLLHQLYAAQLKLWIIIRKMVSPSRHKVACVLSST